MPGRTNRFTRFAHPALPILVPVLVVSLLLAACAGGAGTAAKPAAADGLSGEVSDQSRGGFEAVPDPGGSDTSYADLADRQIVKTGEITIRDLANLIVEVTGYEGEIIWDTSQPDGQPRRCLDTRRAEERFSLERMVAEVEAMYESLAPRAGEGG